jgi:glucoamylase
VVLTGQDGFSPDQARGFTPTPQEFQLGVCPAPFITPPGVSQAEELDYTINQPVTLEGVFIP